MEQFVYRKNRILQKKKQINGSGDKPANGNVVVGLGRERYYCEDMRGEWVDRSVYGRLCVTFLGILLVVNSSFNLFIPTVILSTVILTHR